MVCIVNDVGDFSSLFQSNLIFLDKGKSSEEKKQLIDELFRYRRFKCQMIILLSLKLPPKLMEYLILPVLIF